MIPSLNNLYIFFQFIRFIGFIALAALMVRDLIKGRNHFTPGILVFSVGNVIVAGYSVFNTIFITPTSHYGFIEFNVGPKVYELMRLLILNSGAGLMDIGGIVIIYATFRKQQ